MILISSWDEHGNYDIPAMIDQIISVTEQEKIFYIGHSMGTTGFMVMANDKPAYQDKIHLASFLAPVAVSKRTNIRDLIRTLMLQLLGVNSIFSISKYFFPIVLFFLKFVGAKTPMAPVLTRPLHIGSIDCVLT
jgi:pimeloyl-ACP methyl ester carboxylesterase